MKLLSAASRTSVASTHGPMRSCPSSVPPSPPPVIMCGHQQCHLILTFPWALVKLSVLHVHWQFDFPVQKLPVSLLYPFLGGFLCFCFVRDEGGHLVQWCAASPCACSLPGLLVPPCCLARAGSVLLWARPRTFPCLSSFIQRFATGSTCPEEALSLGTAESLLETPLPALRPLPLPRCRPLGPQSSTPFQTVSSSPTPNLCPGLWTLSTAHCTSRVEPSKL